MFVRMVLAAVVAGLLAGAASSVVQQNWAVPLILQAEIYEAASPGQDLPAPDGPVADGRSVATLATNVLAAIGFGLPLVALLVVRDQGSAGRGLLWGLAGFAVFHAAPSLGLPPELPGAATADLQHRQAWWLFCIVASGAGLAAVVFGRHPGARLAGVGLALLPHLIGAPQPPAYGALAPEDLRTAFVVASLASNWTMWIVLGGTAGFMVSRLFTARGRPS